MNVFEQLGIPTIINAKGTSTRVSGGILPAEVAEAMRQATQACVDMPTLQGRASEIIAEVTGAEAGIVTAGAAAGLMLGTAACIAGLDPSLMNRLPDTTGLKDEVVVVRSQRNLYDHAVRQAGARLVEVGLADRYAGAGLRDAEAWEVADAITERTACVLHVANPQSEPSLAEMVAVAHARGVPVIVDAAGQLPPAGNLRRFIAEGADLVAFSGGKAILGPQASGILCGRRDLVQSAALQMLDQDILFRQWNPPPALFDKRRLKGLPQHGIGRPCKVGKEQVVGLLVALRRFVAEDPAARHAAWLARLAEVQDALRSANQVQLTLVDAGGDTVPVLDARLDPGAGHDVLDLVIALQNSMPSVHVDPTALRAGIIRFNPMALQPGEGRVAGARLAALLGRSG
ncbi:aminotransferase class V-fold PLP-dependent enzyme [Desertibaculum subflavum]|uniref:aminotransferase class V-fold PLP-dependent enzyme n=1 Tax=Desertibaculum subflavum TaxID=2268458 RepID=UPI000E6678DB